MDPLSHVLFGRTLVALDRHRRLGEGSVAACVLGTLAPDVDVLVIPRGWDVYLRVHQFGTHSLVGSIAVASAAAGLVFIFKRSAHYASLMLAASAGALSHLVFDLFSGAVLTPGWPFSHARLSIPLVAMADPWLVGICAGGAMALWMGRRRMTRVAHGVLLAIGVFLAVKGVLLTAAVPQWTQGRGSDAILNSATEAEWGSLIEWNVFDRTPLALRKWRVNAVRGPATLMFTKPLAPELPLVVTSRSLDTVQNFLRVHELGFPILTPIENGGTEVLWSDIRYCRSASECALWFGGAFDRDGRPVMQIVRVGGWQQNRPILP
jgi:membrane-bound metal-dependent hydrolase YbcI (DUF457 family)